jgi:hypothetical protein
MKRRWLQFRLRTLFVLLTLAAVGTGVVRHAWYVRERIQFHEAKALTCAEQLETKINVNTLFVQGMLRAAASQADDTLQEPQRVTNQLPKGHLLYLPGGTPNIVQDPRMPRTDVIWDQVRQIMRDRQQEQVRIEAAQDYHLQQIEKYRRALWRPWLRVTEDYGRELQDEPLASEPQVATPAAPQFPPLPATTQGSPPVVPQLPVEKVKIPWQRIDRPLPHDFDQRDMLRENSRTPRRYFVLVFVPAGRVAVPGNGPWTAGRASGMAFRSSLTFVQPLGVAGS